MGRSAGEGEVGFDVLITLQGAPQPLCDSFSSGLVIGTPVLFNYMIKK